MASEETVGAGIDLQGEAQTDLKVIQHEAAAHQKRNWVRLTYDCNDRCIFCLDSQAHDGRIRDRDEVKAQILDGRRKGAQRLILSGGEPTIHPNFIDFVRLGRLSGYERVQTVTNGRMFAYGDFLKRCLDAGLGEITFSIHGPDAKVHDALVGVQGAYDEEIRGLDQALADGRPIVNVDICVNRANVKRLPEMLEGLYARGVREFDLLQVIPFGRAFVEGRTTLFYDLAEARPWLEQAFAFSRRPDVHIWLNRFPVEHLEGYEHLIQDPYKLNDEVRGRKEEFVVWTAADQPLPCREPERCRYCYVRRLCDGLESHLENLDVGRFEVVRIDPRWEASQPAVYGGDPASARKGRLPVLSNGADARVPPSSRRRRLSDRVSQGEVRTLWVEASDLAQAKEVLASLPGIDTVELELDDITELATALEHDERIEGRELTRVVARTAEQAQRLLQIDRSFEVEVLLDRDTARWLLDLEEVSSRLSLRLPTRERLTESAREDVDLADFFARFRAEVPVTGVPACIVGREPRASRAVLDAATLDPSGTPEIFRYTRRFIQEDYRVKSLRCDTCRYESGCPGLHVNYVRAHGFAQMKPVGA